MGKGLVRKEVLPLDGRQLSEDLKTYVWMDRRLKQDRQVWMRGTGGQYGIRVV